MILDKKQKLLFEMLRIRFIEEEIAREYKNQEIRCPVHLSIGQEAIPVGISAILSLEDKIVSAHRSHAHYLAKGGCLKSLLAEIYGKETGCSKGKGGSMHLFDLNAGQVAAVPIVGSSVSIGTGVGWYLKLSKTDRIVVIYFGDGATEEGSLAESLNFAKLHELPILFVCENNLYSVYSSIEKRQPEKRNILTIVEGHGIKTLNGDGNNVLEVMSLAKSAKESILTGSGPIFLNLSTYRWLEHCGPHNDDYLKYRSQGELKNWMEQCPIGDIKKKLSLPLMEVDELVVKMMDQIRPEVDLAFSYAKQSEFPRETELFTDVYSGFKI